MQSNDNPLGVKAMKRILAKPIGTFSKEGKVSSSWGIVWNVKKAAEEEGDHFGAWWFMEGTLYGMLVCWFVYMVSGFESEEQKQWYLFHDVSLIIVQLHSNLWLRRSCCCFDDQQRTRFSRIVFVLACYSYILNILRKLLISISYLALSWFQKQQVSWYCYYFAVWFYTNVYVFFFDSSGMRQIWMRKLIEWNKIRWINVLKNILFYVNPKFFDFSFSFCHL